MDTERPKIDPQAGVRDRNNAERRHRIREAARQTFCERGYVDATTREICARAGVGNGTLFRHAADKRELLLLIVNDDLDNLHVDASRRILAARKKRALRNTVLDFYRVRYEYFAKFPAISRPFVKEVFNFMGAADEQVGPEARRHRERRDEVVAELRKLISANTRTPGRSASNVQLTAELVHAIYLSASREWLELTDLDPKLGLRRFSELLDLAATGFNADWKK